MRKRILIIVTIFYLISSCHIFKGDKSGIQTVTDNNKRDILKSGINTSSMYTIVFYNVENLFDTINDPKTNDDEFTPKGYKKWSQKRYNKKLDDLAWVLSNINDTLPTVIGLCEVENNQVLKDLSTNSMLINGQYKTVHEESPDERGIDVALMYRSDLFEYFSHKSIPVNIENEPDVKLRDILYVKGAFEGSDTFHIFVNHWKSRRGGIEETEYKRLRAAEILKNETEKIFNNNKNASIIIMGDFNDEPFNNSLSEVLQATDNKNNEIESYLFNLLYEKAKKGEGTISRDYRWFMFDNIIVSKSLTEDIDFFAEGKTGHIFKPEKILYYNAKADIRVPNKTYGGKNYYGGYSDHLPVYFVLKRE